MSKKLIILLSFFGIFSIFVLLVGFGAPVLAQEDGTPFKSTPYPVPRFVSLGSGEVSVRTGPGRKYPVKWMLKKRGVPVEIILEYENWRKIKDHEGAHGWVHGSLISGRRTGLIKAEESVGLRRKAKANARLVAMMEPGSLINIEDCDATWCRVRVSGYKGFVKQNYIWGVYENEVFD